MLQTQSKIMVTLKAMRSSMVEPKGELPVSSEEQLAALDERVKESPDSHQQRTTRPE